MENLWELWLGFCLSILFFTFIARVVLVNITKYMCNNSNHRKRRKGQNFFDWLFFRRFRDVIPTYYFFYYYSPFVVGILAIIATIIIILVCGDTSDLVIWPFRVHYFGHAIWLLFDLLSARDKNGDYDASNVVSKRRKKK